MGHGHLDSLDLPQSLGRRSQASDEAGNSCLIAGRWTSSGAPCEKTKLFIEGSPRPRHGVGFLTPFPPCPPLSHVTLATTVTSCFQIKALLRYDSRTVKLTFFKVYRTRVSVKSQTCATLSTNSRTFPERKPVPVSRPSPSPSPWQPLIRG